ncbi:MAG TPA: glycosyl hydrolase family 18 protein [bacterium]|nr:glycosyl hydrolase family 18 protein [bacterium]HPR87696.1 glycosyl hydrolase family 18 protein [bacterium]
MKTMTLTMGLGLALALGVQAAERVVGYYPSWIRYTTPAAKIRYQDVTTIAHSFIWPRPDGTLDMYSDLLYPELITRAHAAGVKVIVSIGGWGQCDGFAPMAASSTTRQAFVDKVTAFLQQNGYDGIDLDWEYPTGAVQRANFTLLVREFRKAFDALQPAWTISFVVPSGTYSASYFDFAGLREYVSWIGCMTYDLHGAWTSHAGHNSPLYAPANEPEGSIDSAVRYLLGLGLAREKLLIGVPFYGRQFAATGLYAPASGGEEITYAQLIAAVKPDWTRQWDDLAKVPYYQNGAHTLFITFDDTAAVRYKCAYVRSNALGGLIIWALGQDNLGTSQPLAQAIGDHLTHLTASVATPGRLQPEDHELIGCYPNPCNSATRVRFHLEKAGEATLLLFDLCGRRLKSLSTGPLDAGWHETVLTLEELSSGIYYLRLAGPDRILTIRLTLIR